MPTRAERPTVARYRNDRPRRRDVPDAQLDRDSTLVRSLSSTDAATDLGCRDTDPGCRDTDPAPSGNEYSDNSEPRSGHTENMKLRRRRPPDWLTDWLAVLLQARRVRDAQRIARIAARSSAAYT